MGSASRRPAYTLTAFVAGAVLFLSACAGEAPAVPDDGEPVLSPILRVDPIGGFELPLDAYQPDAAGRTLIDRAHAEVFRGCMTRFGFVLRSPNLAVTERPQRNRQRYGIWDEAQAAQLGYHAPVTPAPTSDPQLDQPAARSVATGTGQTVDGLPEGGCQGEANRTIDAGTPGGGGQSDLVDRLSWDAYNRAEKDSRVRRATEAWSTCMAKAGYRYRTPMQANNDPAFGVPSPSTTEIQIAVTDVRCKRSTDLFNVYATVESAYQRRSVERNAHALRQAQTSRDRILRNAAAVLDEPGA